MNLLVGYNASDERAPCVACGGVAHFGFVDEDGSVTTYCVPHALRATVDLLTMMAERLPWPKVEAEADVWTAQRQTVARDAALGKRALIPRRPAWMEPGTYQALARLRERL